ncbi:DoxX family protein [Piscinibacterium candidicorallinum]|uniref:DoxX family protein n=1 Tax=Piscinibacterium candidicorallinum TaxID=1793872 RepID=A0ABV7H3C4_9BURK
MSKFFAMSLPPTTLPRSRLAWILMRVGLAGLIAIHGIARWATDSVTPFGAWLTAGGWPLGPVLAWCITLFEIVGPILLMLGKGTRVICVASALLYLMGIALVHAKAGWFVVGLGRNGAEYSVLLVLSLLLLAWQDCDPVSTSDSHFSNPEGSSS